MKILLKKHNKILRLIDQIFLIFVITMFYNYQSSFGSYDETEIEENNSTEKNIIEYSLDKEVTEKFSSFSSKFLYDPYRDPYYGMKIMGEKLCELFPEKLIQTLHSMGKNGDTDILLIKGMPIDSIIPSGDSVIDRCNRKGKVSENVILGVADIMGYKLYSNVKQQQGKIVHNIAPVKEYEHTSSSRGREPFFLHTENPYEQIPPYFLILLCLEEEPEAKTTYFFLNDFLKTFPTHIIENMKNPEFRIFSGAAYDQIEEGVFSLISREKDTGFMRLRLYEDHQRIEPLSSRSKETLNYIAQAFTKQQKNIGSISLQRGECLIFNNGWWLNGIGGGMMHGRKGYIKNPSRWLQRGYFYPQTLQDKQQLDLGYLKAKDYLAKSNYISTVKNMTQLSNFLRIFRR